MKNKIIATLSLALLLGCGSTDNTDNNLCSTDDAGYVSFSQSTSNDAGCTASYTIKRGIDTSDCTCPDLSFCAQSSMFLMAEGQACYPQKN